MTNDSSLADSNAAILDIVAILAVTVVAAAILDILTAAQEASADPASAAVTPISNKEDPT